MLTRWPCSQNFQNLCDNFVKKLVIEIRKCRQLQGDFVPLTLMTRGFAPGPQRGSAPHPHKCSLLPEALDALVTITTV